MRFSQGIYDGTWQDAVRRTIQSNHGHGLPRTNEDKRRTVELALKELPDQSDRVLAEMAAVSPPMVAKLRKQLKTVVSSTKRVGRDGKCRKMPTPKKRPAKETNGSAATQDKAQTGATEGEKPKGQEASESNSAQAQENTSSGNASADYEFDPAEAWKPVEQYLLHALADWPKLLHHTFGERLQKFADAHFN